MTSLRFKLSQLILLVVAGIVSIGSAAVAQIKVTSADENNSYTETIEMTVSAAAQTDPIFKYRLTWPPRETIAGNAATAYLHSLGENRLRYVWRSVIKEFGEDVESWAYYSTPRDQILLDKLKQASAKFDSYIQHHIERATRRRDCDWGLELEDLTGPRVVGLELNGIQETRSISRAIALQTKLAILESRFDDAIDLMRMNYRLGENVGRIQILIAGLVGLSEIGVSNGSMTDFIAAPDSPNMYWALTELPRPMINIREAIRMECGSVLRMFPAMANAETTEHSPEEWSRIVQEMPRRAMEYTSLGSPDTLRTDFIPTGIGILTYAHAKKRLMDSGMDAATVEKMAVGQVLLIDAKREYQRLADLLEKEAYLPFPGSEPRHQKISNLFRLNSVPASPGKIIAGMVLPAIHAVRTAQIRTQRDVDALRTIEALRMHAAETGKLPSQLSDIKAVEVPNNPATGKPFKYRLDGEVAILELPRSDGPVYSKRYKISLR